MCSRMILWCWNSWHQHDSYEQDEDIHPIFDQENIHSHLNHKEPRKCKLSIKLQNYKTTKLQNFKTTKLQNYKITKLQNYKTTKLQSYKATKP